MIAVTMTGAFLAAPLLNKVLDAPAVLLGAAGFLAVASAIALLGVRAPDAHTTVDTATDDDSPPLMRLPEARSAHSG